MDEEIKPPTTHDPARCAAPHGSGCPHCAARVQPWLIAYTEGWYGPRAGWTEKTRSRYYEWFAIVDSFARGFRFAPDATQNDQAHLPAPAETVERKKDTL